MRVIEYYTHDRSFKALFKARKNYALTMCGSLEATKND